MGYCKIVAGNDSGDMAFESGSPDHEYSNDSKGTNTEKMIDNPIDFIHEGLGYKASTPEEVEKVFSAWINAKRYTQIPSLNEHNVDDIPNHTLVRFRCMVQDNSYSAEYYLDPIRLEKNGEESTYSGILCDCNEHWTAKGYNVLYNSEPNKESLSMRYVSFCISPPFESKWAEEYYTSQSSSVQSPSGSTETQRPAHDPRLIQRIPHLPGNGNYRVAIVKTYENVGMLKLNDLVEVIGILEKNICKADLNDGGLDTNSISGSTVDAPADRVSIYNTVPRLHCIAVRNRDELSMQYMCRSHLRSGALLDTAERGGIIRRLSGITFGDELAAEYLLLGLFAKSPPRIDNLHNAGSFSINFYSSDKTRPIPHSWGKSLSEAIGLFLEHQVYIPLNLSDLNAKYSIAPYALYPQNKDEFDKDAEFVEGVGLMSGYLQLVESSGVVIDETKLMDGRLGEKGTKNMGALSSAMNDSTLVYEIPYSNVAVPLNYKFFIVSQARSIFRPRFQVPVVISESLCCEVASLMQKEELDNLRYIIMQSRKEVFNVNSDMADKISKQYALRRREVAEQGSKQLPTQKSFSDEIEVARLVAMSKGRHELTEDDWEHALSLEKERLRRVNSVSCSK